MSKRVLTYFKLNQDLVLGQFGTCVLSHFTTQNDSNQVEVCCDLNDQGLVLSLPKIDSKKSVMLRHPPFCPMLHLSQEERNTLKPTYPGISVAVAVILESCDQKVLLTRRPPHMRTFPNVWVPPGGGSEENETIIETGLRELKEETGLDLKNLKNPPDPLCLWESVYPPLLAKGSPKRHQLVVYLHICVENFASDLEVCLDPQETDAFMWLNLEQIKIATDFSTKLDPLSQIQVYELNGKVDKSYEILRNEVPTSGDFDVERISTGTRFALERFYVKKLNKL